ncbi:MAG: hypothetical protein N3G22_01695 [Candidatus Micrarchaeota archaeon]|nr:hypothetical protein [Candidatus Micrarchaeota archaeon]
MEEQQEVQERMAAIFPFLMLAMIFLFALLPFLVPYPSNSGRQSSFDPDAFIQAKHFHAFVALVVLNAILTLVLRIEMGRPNSRFPPRSKKIIPFAMSEFPALMGFVLAFMNENPYLVLPFAAFSLGMWIYFYSRKD